MALDDPPGQAQPESDALDIRRARRIGPEEPLENVGLRRGADADAGIANRKTRRRSLPCYVDEDTAAGRGELDRVVEEVQHEPLQPLAVAGHYGRIHPPALDRDALGVADRL